MKKFIKKFFSLIWGFLTSNRMKSLYWRSAMMALSFLIDFAIKNLSEFNIPVEYVALVGLLLGEISKAINAKLISNRIAKSKKSK